MRGCGTVFNDDPPELYQLDELDELTLGDVERLAKRFRWQADQLDIAIRHCREKQSIQGLSEMVAFNFNAQQFKPNFGGGGEQLPPGKQYKVVVVDSGTDKTGDGNGGFLFTKLTVVEGPLHGKSQMLRFNLHNTNAKTVEIANEQLSALCHAVGVFQMVDTAQLHDKPFLIDVDWQKGNAPGEAKGGEFGGYTEVKAIYDLGGNKPGKGGGVATNAQPQQQQGGFTPPPAGVQAQGGWDANAGQQGGQQQPPQQQGYQQPPQGQQQPPPQQGGQQGWGGPPQGQPQQGIDNNVPPPGNYNQQGGQPPQQGQGQPPQQGGWGGNGGAAPGGWGAT